MSSCRSLFLRLIILGIITSIALSGCSGGGNGDAGGSAAAVVGPVVQSIPPSGAQVGHQLLYQLNVASSSPATLVFALTAPIAGMSINVKTGLFTWTPTSPQIGDQSVTVSVTDSQGQTSQTFPVTVFDTNPVASALISKSAGGVVTVSNAISKINGLSVNIPAGALPSDLTITLSELTLPTSGRGSEQGFVKGFTIDPPGTQLSTPATLTIPYSLAQWPANSGIPLESSLGVFSFDPRTGRRAHLENFTVSTSNHTVTGTLPHFSAYVASTMYQIQEPIGLIPHDSAVLPVILVHGYQFGGLLGKEATWGKLRTLLDQPGPKTPIGISAWRFLWNSQDVRFEVSAAGLAEAIAKVRSQTRALNVNLLAHSFGGILVRTYLQGQGNIGFQNDVGRVMTLGTPHSGIGGDLSIDSASTCARDSNRFKFVTCWQMNVGGGGEFEGSGDFLRGLNQVPFPPLGLSPPTYYIISGNELGSNGDGDGLITLAGQSICSANGCSNPNVKPITFSGLCHSRSSLVRNCPGAAGNIPEVEINDRNHPLWKTIYDFLGNEDVVTIEGTVFGRSRSEIIPGAVVSTSWDAITTQSDGSGHFLLVTNTPIVQGVTCCVKYTITIAAPGFPTFSGTTVWGDHPTNHEFLLSPPQP
jgi:pimeloyl-ACP methyl ester carboxylesterase